MTENKFSCPVSMKVTQEQYEQDLKQALLDLGYYEKDFNFSHPRYFMLCTNHGGVHRVITNLWDSAKSTHNRYFIDHYNPELFLALAGMREGDQIHVGEYMVYADNDLCKITSVDDCSGLSDSAFKSKNHEGWRKATKGEIIDWFTIGREICEDEELLHTVAVNPQDPYSPSEPSFSTWEYNFSPEEVYIKKSDDVGYKESENKLSYELDWDFIEAMAKRMQKGSEKYSPYNWKKPLNPEKLKQALLRHTIDIMRGVYEDDGSELGHIEAVADNAMMLWYQLKHNNKTNE